MQIDDQLGDSEERLAEFAEHLATCQSELQAYVFAMVQNMADAEDICQRVAVVLWRKFDQYQRGTEFSSWAFKTAKYEALNFIRRRRRERVFFSEDTILLIADTASSRAADRSAAEARWAVLKRCLEKLPGHRRELITLYYEGSRTVSQVAARLGRTETAIRSALCRARKDLRGCVEGLTREGA